MQRRTFVIGAAALAWAPTAAAAGAPDPLAGLPRRLRKRLHAFANLVAERRWVEVVAWFDPEHVAGQHEIYFSPDYAEPSTTPPDPADPAAQEAFRRWYLIEVLGLGMVDNHVEQLEDVVAIRYRAWKEPFGEEGPLQVELDVQTRVGPRTGWFFVDRESNLFFGASG